MLLEVVSHGYQGNVQSAGTADSSRRYDWEGVQPRREKRSPEPQMGSPKQSPPKLYETDRSQETAEQRH